MYVVAQQPPGLRDVVDLTFFFVYAFNGPQGARIRTGPLDVRVLLPEFAEHQGDIESITVRVDGATGTRDVAWVRYEAHGGDMFVSPLGVTWTDQHPHVLVGLGSHASHPQFTEDFWVDDAPFSTGRGITRVALEIGDVLDPSSTLVWHDPTLVEIGLDRDFKPINDQGWAAFGGRLGAVHRENHYRGATWPNGDPVRIEPFSTLANDAVWLAELAGLFDKYKFGDGPPGLRAKTGGLMAQVAPASSPWREVLRLGSDAVVASPVVAEGFVYFVRLDGSLQRIDTSGATQEALTPARGCAAPPFIDGSVAYFAGQSGWPSSGGALSRVDTNGAGLAQLGDTAFGRPFVSAGIIYHEGNGNALMQMRTDGGEKTQVEGYRTISSPVVCGDGLYFRGTDDYLWRYDLVAGGQPIHLGETTDTPCVPGDGFVYYKGTDTGLWCVPEKGPRSDNRQVGRNLTGASPGYREGILYFQGTDEDRLLNRVAVDGSPQSQWVLDGRSCLGSPVPADDGSVYFLAPDMRLYRCEADLPA